MNLSIASAAAKQKLLLFGLLGAAGCIVGWFFGEPLLATMQRDLAYRAGTSNSAGVFFWLIVEVALWTALLSLGLAFSLVVGQNCYLHKAWLTRAQGTAVLGGATIAGIASGAVAQFLFGLFSQSPSLIPVARVAAWALFGTLLGAGAAFFIPNLPRGKAAAAGAVGGSIGAIAFMAAAGAGSEVVGRFLGTGILGFAIGLMVAWVEAVAREAWLEIQYGPNESRTVNLGAQAVTIGSNREFCTVYANGAAPIALRYTAQQERVTCEDVAGARSFDVLPGDQRRAGNVTVVVRAAKASGSTASPSRLKENVAGGACRGSYLRIKGNKTLLNSGTKLTTEVIQGLVPAARHGIVAEVVPHPKVPDTLGLKNASTRTWRATMPGGEKRLIEPGKSITLAAGAKINFGDVEGTLE